jgi:hypothetical protein
MTRLLNTPIIGPNAEIVDSSWIDMLAGLSRCGSLRVPPGFCAWATGASDSTASRTAVAAKRHRCLRIFFPCAPAEVFRSARLDSKIKLYGIGLRDTIGEVPIPIFSRLMHYRLLHLQQICSGYSRKSCRMISIVAVAPEASADHPTKLVCFDRITQRPI